MAKHRRMHHRRRHRRFGDPVISMPSFGDAKEYNPLGKHVNSTDVAIGAGVGLAGGGLIMYAQKTFWPTAPSFVSNYIGPISALGAGVAAYSLYRKKSRARAEGYLAGAAIVGVIPVLYGMVKGALPTSVSQYFGDPVQSIPSFGGFIVRRPQPGFGSFIVGRPQPGVPMLPTTARRAMTGRR